MKLFELIEEEDCKIARTEVEESCILQLHRNYKEKIRIDFPSPVTDQSYILRSKGYIGYIPVSDDYLFRIHPKVPIGNIFRMLEYAYNLKSFQFLDGRADIESIEDLFEHLVSVLAKRVLDRARKGLYRDYLRRQEDLKYIRGKIMLMQSCRAIAKGSTTIECEYQEHTADLIDNQILAWTLYQLPRFVLKRDDVRQQVRQAHYALAGAVAISPVCIQDCIARLYHRLNEDYKPLHSLCRFFLEQCGPSLKIGDHFMQPFTLHMPNLFETFVAEWLRSNMDSGMYISPQYEATLDDDGRFLFRIDLVLVDEKTERILAVMDTKYKRESRPSEEDIKDIVAYAARMKTACGVLIYPSIHTENINLRVGNINVRSLKFDLADNPEDGGRRFLDRLMAILQVNIQGGH
jgi:5-methylcytosine-specific restriction enzyme subunit McrC